MLGLSRLVIIAASLLVVGVLARPPSVPMRSEDGPVLPRRELLKTLGAPQKPLIADYYWLMTIQQVGRATTASDFRDVYFYADLTTELDPGFRYAYEWGALTTPFTSGRDQWVNVDLSNRLLEKAIKQFPNDGRLKMLMAYNKLSYEREYRAAADWIMKAANSPGVPDYLPQLATRLYAQTGAFETGLEAARMLRDTADDEESRAFYEKRLLEIERERVLQQVDALVDRFRKEQGRDPRDIQELVRVGLLKGIPTDPQGGEIFLDPHSRARSTSGLYRLEVFDNDRKRELRKDMGLPEDADLNLDRSKE